MGRPLLPQKGHEQRRQGKEKEEEQINNFN
jgi:hypothetical protein